MGIHCCPALASRCCPVSLSYAVVVSLSHVFILCCHVASSLYVGTLSSHVLAVSLFHGLHVVVSCAIAVMCQQMMTDVVVHCLVVSEVGWNKSGM